MTHVKGMSQLVSSGASGTADCPPPVLRESDRGPRRAHGTSKGNPHGVPIQVDTPVRCTQLQ